MLTVKWYSSALNVAWRSEQINRTYDIYELFSCSCLILKWEMPLRMRHTWDLYRLSSIIWFSRVVTGNGWKAVQWTWEATNEATKAARNKQKVAKRKGGTQRERERRSVWVREGEDSCLKCFAQFGPTHAAAIRLGHNRPYMVLQGASNRLSHYKLINILSIKSFDVYTNCCSAENGRGTDCQTHMYTYICTYMATTTTNTAWDTDTDTQIHMHTDTCCIHMRC